MKHLLICLVPLILSPGAIAGPAATPFDATSLVFTSDGKTILTAGMDGFVRLLDRASGKERAAVRAHEGGVLALALAADGKHFLTGGTDKVVRFWNLTRIKEIQTYEGHASGVSAVALSPDGKLAASGDRHGNVYVWERGAGKRRHALRCGVRDVRTLAFAPDGKTLAGCGIEIVIRPDGSKAPQDGLVRLWDVASGKERRLPEHGERLAFLSGGREIAITGSFFDPAPGKTGGPFTQDYSRTVIWDLASGRRGMSLGETCTGLAVSASDRFIATVCDSSRYLTARPHIWVPGPAPRVPLRLWEKATGKPVWEAKVHNRNALVLALAPDGGLLVAGGSNGQVHFHDLRPEGWKPANKWGAADFERAWQTLAGGDPKKAYGVVWDFSAQGEAGVRWLKGKLKPADLDAGRVRQWIADLDSENFGVRQAARKELEQLGESADLLLREVHGKAISLELKLSLERLLARFEKAGPSPDRLRIGRALTVLERVGGPTAKEVLRELGKGSAGVYLTEEARHSLRFLAQKESDREWLPDGRDLTQRRR